MAAGCSRGASAEAAPDAKLEHFDSYDPEDFGDSSLPAGDGRDGGFGTLHIRRQSRHWYQVIALCSSLRRSSICSVWVLSQCGQGRRTIMRKNMDPNMAAKVGRCC